MTAEPTVQTGQDAPVIEAPPVVVQPRGNSRLATLHARYREAKAAVKAAEAELKAITDGIKLELNSANPEARKVDLVDKGGDAPALRLSFVETWRFDSTRFKRDDPLTYVRYAKRSGSWRLEELKSTEGGDQE